MKGFLIGLFLLMPSIALAQTPLDYSDGTAPVETSPYPTSINRSAVTLSAPYDPSGPIISQSGLDIETVMPHIEATGVYNKAAANFYIRIDEDSGFGAAIGVQTLSFAQYGNMNSRLWGGVLESAIVPTSDGSMVTLELDNFNNAALDNPNLSGLQKIGLMIVADGNQNSGSAIQVINANAAKWWDGLVMPPSSLKSGGYFLNYIGDFTVDQAGNVKAMSYKVGVLPGLSRTITTQGLHGWCTETWTGGLLTASTC